MFIYRILFNAENIKPKNFQLSLHNISKFSRISIIENFPSLRTVLPHTWIQREGVFYLKRSILNEGQEINCPNSFSSYFQRFFCVSEHSETMGTVRSKLRHFKSQAFIATFWVLNTTVWTMLPVKEFKNDELTCR